MKVAAWIEEKFPTETLDVSYPKLYTAINLYKDREPDFILAAAQLNTLGELEEIRRDNNFLDHEHEPSDERFAPCKICGKMMRL